MTGTRRLAAIMAADVAGYSRLMGEDEAGTARAVRERREASRPIVATHGGRIVKTMGDGVLLEFPSVVAAVECAIGVQQLMAELNAGLPENKRIVYRIGINLGDVLIEGDDILGDGVNIAARVESIAEPGGICVSDFAYQQVRGKVAAEFTDLGEKALKNIARPVRVFALDLATTPLRPKPGAMADGPAAARRGWLIPTAALAALIVIAAGVWFALKPPPEKAALSHPPPQAGEGREGAAAAHLSIVVLPFTNLSNDPKQDYFADGITDNLTTDLSRIRNSFVIARNTAFTFKGKSIDAKEIGKDLGVRYVLEGSVQRDGNRVRVNAQLIDAESGAHLWADRFEEDLADLFKLQDDVVARLANTLGYELVKAEAAKSVHSTNPDAIDLTMQGWALLNVAGREEARNDQALRLFEHALNLDPENVEAMIGIALIKTRAFAFGWDDSSGQLLKEALEIETKALTINPNYALGYYVKSFTLFMAKRSSEAVDVAKTGTDVDPNAAFAFFAMAQAEKTLGRCEEAIEHIKKAFALNPRDPGSGVWHFNISAAELCLGHYDAAIEASKRALDMGFRTFQPYLFWAAAAALKGDDIQAKVALAEALRLHPNLTVKWWASHSGVAPNILEGLRKAGLPEDDAPKLSIVVLPFQNLSGDAKQDYLADVLTDELTTYISRIPGSFVIARNTAFTYKGKPTDVKTIGKDLGVRYALEGSVQPTDKRIRTNAQLIDTETGAHLWAEEFDNDKTDLLQTQDEIVTRLARTLQLQLTEIEAARLTQTHPANSEAQELALRCDAMVSGSGSLYGGKDADAGYALCEKAVEIDPKNGVALGFLSIKFGSRVQEYMSVDRDADLARSEEFATRALAIDPNNAYAFVGRAFALIAQGRFEEAGIAAEHALALAPSLIEAYNLQTLIDLYVGNADKVIESADKAMRLSPRDPLLFNLIALKGTAYFMRREDDKAIELFRLANALNPSPTPNYFYLAAAQALSGNEAEARQTLKRYLAIPGVRTRSIAAWKARTYSTNPAYLAMRERIYEGLRKAGMPEDDAPKLSIVVLPFQNLSGDAKQDYLADVLTDELTTYISRIPGSFVIARNTAFTYKGKPTDVKTIGKDLGVRYALEGSVQPTTTRIRTNAQLIDTETGAHLWAEEFDNDKTDLLQTQDEIVTRLARTLDIQLTQVEAARADRLRPENPDAQELALRCLVALNNNNNATEARSAAAAIYDPCEQALKLDPRNVLALSLLAYEHGRLVIAGQSADTEADLKQAEDLTARALAINPNDGWAHFARMLMLFAAGRSDETIVEARRTLSLNPSSVPAYYVLAGSLIVIGQLDEGLRVADQAIRLSPRDPRLFFAFYAKAQAHIGKGNDAEAADWARRTLTLAPNYAPAAIILAAALGASGKEANARAAYQRLIAIPGNRLTTVKQVKAYYARQWPVTSAASAALHERIYRGLQVARMPEQ